jgi:glycosyltransferase involved in cell wall biosynthesis
MPQVSVVISTYNSAQFLPATVESVLAQTFKDYELIIVDDGSTDNTQEVLAPYRGRLNYIYQENKKYSRARNTGIRAASSQYIAFLDSDDVWYPEKLEEQVAILEQHPEVTLAHCQAAYIDAEGSPRRFQGKQVKGSHGDKTAITDVTRDLFFGTLVTTSTAVLRHSTLDQVGLFDDTHIHGEDWELWVRMASQGPFAYIPKPLVKYRIYGWRKILSVEVLDDWLADQFKTMETAVACWKGDAAERDRLRAQGTATIYVRSALSNFQLGRGPQGQERLEHALALCPELGQRERLVELAADRAKLIEAETGSYQEAEEFIRTFFDHLPRKARAAQHKGARQEATSWLYVGSAFEQRDLGHLAAARKLLARGIQESPACLKNRGVLSLSVEVWLGKTMASATRQIGRRTTGQA